MQPGLIACLIVLANLALLQNERNLPKCFKPDYEDVYLIIDCTESQVILDRVQRPQHWKSFDCSVTSNAASLLSDIYPGSKSDEEILSQSGYSCVSLVEIP